jgi:peptidoglycan/xylan/chitin deacetylase (PgdA/CDA1 family)
MKGLWAGAARFGGQPGILTSVAAAAALVTSLSSWAMWAAPAAATTPTVVTLGFDDGTLDQFTNCFPILDEHGMHATFFVNTGPILADDPSHMTFADLHTMANAGNEIAGHTIDHANIKPLSVADAEHEVCDDRNTLLARGFVPESFAYPFGSFDGTSDAVVHYCGYNSGRLVTGVSKTGPFGETIPPADAYATRTPPNPKTATKLSTLESYVLNAEADTQSTDWVQFVFHRVCDKSTGGHCGAYSISPNDLSAFLDFLQGEVNAGRVVVETTAQVIGGPLSPPASGTRAAPAASHPRRKPCPSTWRPIGKPEREGHGRPGWCPKVKRGEDWLSTAAAGVTDQTAASSPAMAAVSCGTSDDAESCIASATIRAAAVEAWTADRPLCRFVHRRACTRPARSAKMTSWRPGCSTWPENVR